MTIFFDKNNLESFISSYSDDRFGGAFKSVKNHMNIQMNFTKEELKAGGRSSEVILKFLSKLMEGRGNFALNFDSSPYPERPITLNLHSKLKPKPRAVMLLDDEKLASCKQVGACAIGGVGEELETICSFFLGNDGDGYERKFIVGASDPEIRLSSWQELHSVILPFYDLIISDRYILKCDEYTFKNNFGKILEVLHTGRTVKSNIVLFTELPDFQFNWSYEKIREVVTEVTTQITGKAANFTLIWAKNRGIIKHDRNIITNYQWFFSGNSLNYFGTNNSVLADGCTLAVYALANKNNRKCAEGHLLDMQEGINKLKQLNPDFIQGNKKSNFLKF